jgi:hypothetical protein
MTWSSCSSSCAKASPEPTAFPRLHALTGESHKSFGTVRYGTVELQLGRLGHEPDLSAYRYVNPLPARISL